MPSTDAPLDVARGTGQSRWARLQPGHPETRGAGLRLGRSLAVLLLFAALAVAHTWPLATAPGTLSRNDNGDTILNEWVLAWVAHQLPRAPLRLFQANIFYPERNSLAFSEHMVVQSVMGMPLFWLGASPVLVYNVLLMMGLALTGWTMYLVVERWTGDAVAGLAAGSLAAFNTHVFTRMPHLQALHAEFLPLAVLALDRVLAVPTARSALALGALFALQGLTSIYWLAFITIAFVAATLSRPADWTGGRLRRVAPMLALAAAVALAAVVPFLVPYYQVTREQGLVRTLGEVAMHSATWRDYFSTTNHLHYWLWSRHVWASGAQTALFPGVVCLGLAAVAVASRVAWRDVRARLWLAIALVSLACSFGTHLPSYAWLYHGFPLLQGVRAPARMGHLTLLALAALAGFGLAHLRRRGAHKGWGTVASIALLAVVHIEALRAPILYTAAVLPPAEYDVLARERRAVVVEFPFYIPRQIFGNAQYMLNSTRHWRPLVNGYSGFVPQSYGRHYVELLGFPDERSLKALRDLGVTHVVVHHAPPSPVAAAFGPMPPVPALQPVAGSPALTIYRLRWERVPGNR